ncbi:MULTISPECIES: TonB-dependent receptor [unclassified Spirosoma]|uniref:TonB-dependent receptor n=1 Tax=unclassified Spirosoma TaxID=2621999 RepID=UPI00095AC456|nr:MULTISPECIES: TonB-dependent receptor [unclassified Spirosoma]MBN8823162.1 TonB-dependent receptor [Spirosoma sp.]OJW73246.1 MAG: collagen-binding protein [Spirosoma sp. 48-14]
MKHGLPVWLCCLFIGTLSLQPDEAQAQPATNTLATTPEKPARTAGLTISGYVKDGANGEGLIGVSVYVKETGTGAVTNSYGFYAITLPPGGYNLVVSYIGYAKQTRTVELTDKNVRLDLELKQEGKDLQEVVVSANREDDNVKNIEMSVNRIDVKTLQRIPALLGEVDVIRSIQLLPGVTTVGEGATGFNVRGGSIDQNLVLLDEAPVYNSSHLFGFFSVFNPDAVKDVKLIKGGIPSNYGGRIASILDVRLKEGNAKKPELNGGIGLIFSRLSYERPLFKGKGSFIVAARRSYADILAQPFLNSDLKGAKFYFYDLTAKGNYRINDKNTVFLSGYLGRDVFGSDFGFNWGNATVSARWNHIFSERLFLNTTAYYSNYDYSLNTDLKQKRPNDFFRTDSRIVDYSLKPDFSLALGKNLITFGGQVIIHDFQPGTATAASAGVVRSFGIENKHALETALYVGNEQQLTPQLQLQYGLRYSLFNYTGPGEAYTFQTDVPVGTRRQVLTTVAYKGGSTIQTYGNWEPRLAAKYELSGNSSLKVSYNRLAQYIHLISNTTASTPLDVWTPSTNNVKPQIADQVAAGYFKNFGHTGREFEASVEVYYKWLQNQIDYIDGASLILNKYLEGDLLSGKGRAYGAEFFVKRNTGVVNGWVSYTLAKTERQVAGISNGDWYPTRFDKRHTLTSVLLFDPPQAKRWNFSATFTLASGTPGTFPTNRFEYEGFVAPIIDGRNNYRIPAYHRLDLAATLQGRKRPGKRKEDNWVFSVYNVYARKNPFSVYFQPNADNPRVTEAIKYSVFATIIPSVTYNFKF